MKNALRLLFVICHIVCYSYAQESKPEASGPLADCTEKELGVYAVLSLACELPKCLREEAGDYMTTIAEKYPDADQTIVGVQFAACGCSCKAEQCEVHQILQTDNLSPSCRASLLKKCSINDEKLTERCTALSSQFPGVYDHSLDDDPLGFTKKCESCSKALRGMDSTQLLEIVGDDDPQSFIEKDAENTEAPPEEEPEPEQEEEKPADDSAASTYRYTGLLVLLLACFY